MANQVQITFAGDSKSLERTFDRVGSSAMDMAKTLDRADDKARGFGKGIDKATEAVDASESKFMGTADLLDGMASAFGLNIDGAITMARAFGDMASGLAQVVGPALSKVLGMLGLQTAATEAQVAATTEAAVAQTGLNAALFANPIGAVVAALAVLVGAFVLAYKNSETFRDFVTSAFDTIKKAIGPVIDIVGKVVGFIGGLFSKHKEEISDDTEFTKQRLADLNALLENQRQKWQQWKDGVTEQINGILNPLQNAQSQATISLAEINKNLTDNVNFFQGWMNNLTLLTKRGFGDLAGELYKLGPTAANAVGEATKMTDKELRTLTARFGYQGYVATQEFNKAFLTNESLKAMGDSGVQYGTLFKKGFDLGVSGSNVSIPLNGLGKAVPRLADGGIVSSPTLAVIGEAGPEAVVPLNKMGSVGGGGVTVVVQGNVLDGRQLGDMVQEALLSKQRRSGNLGFVAA